MTEMTYCQSCGMPLTEGTHGTEHDGSKKQRVLSILLQTWGFCR
ncbi:MAG: zinc ribbon domain-containing protein [Enterococcus raffinosus]